MMIEFAMNRTCAPQLSLPAFLSLASAAGMDAVEIRNDIPGQEFMDGTGVGVLRTQLEDAGMRVASVNALQRFNDWTTEREAEARALLTFAAELGAPGVVLCPVHTAGHGWTGVQSETKLRTGLKMLRPILQDLGILGYVEPLGMPASTMKTQRMAVDAIGDIDGWEQFALCFDTFQFFRCGDTALFPEKIGLAHMSGITRGDLAPGALTEPDRGLVGATDRVNNLQQLRALVTGGYGGFISMEPFDPGVQQSVDLARQLKESFARVRSALSVV